MKKMYIILICIMVALISGILGFTIGININLNRNNYSTSAKPEEESLVGTYKTNNWNGKEAVIALKSDKTMISPNGNGTWLVENGKLYIEYDTQAPQMTQDGQIEYKTIHKKQEVTVVESGLIYNDKFFEKINK